MPYRVEPTPGGGTDLVFPTLVPGDQVTISYLYFPPITWGQINGTTKSDEGLAKIIHVLPTQQYSPWIIRLLFLLTCVGAVSIIYFVIYGLRRLIAEAA
jgi:hypothetical protein